MQTPAFGLPRYRSLYTLGSSHNGEGHANAVMVAIETSQLEDNTTKVVSGTTYVSRLANIIRVVIDTPMRCQAALITHSRSRQYEERRTRSPSLQ